MRMFKNYNKDIIKNLIVYPAWDGKQIVFMIDWEDIGNLNFKIIRNDLTFPEKITTGSEVLDDQLTYGEISIFNDFQNLTGNSWYYYSVFIEDGDWKRVATVECFSFGSDWAKEEIWNRQLPDIPFKVDDKKTEKRIVREGYFSYDGKVENSPIKDTLDPQKVFVNEEERGYQHQLERYIRYLSYEIDKYVDLVNAYSKLFRIDTMPLFMLDLVSELVKMEFKKDFSPIYKRQLIRFSIPRAKRKGTNKIIKWVSRLIMQMKNVYIQEFGNNVIYWNDIGNTKDIYNNHSELVTESIGSFWHGENLTGGVFGCFSEGSYLLDNSIERIYSPYVYGIYLFFHVENPIMRSDLVVLNHYLERNIAWLNKWFTNLVQKTIFEKKSTEVNTAWRDLDYKIVCWNFEDTGWTDEYSILP